MRDRRSLLRRGAGVLVVLALAGGAAACSDGDSAPTATEIVYVTESAGQAPSSTESSPAATPKRGLAASFAALTRELGQPVGVSMAPVGGGEVVSLGEQTPQVAWSTIKVPLALAAQRKNGRMPAESPAIVASDNGSAEALWASLGTDQQAAAAVTAVLREGGDENSVVPSERRRPEFTIFGQTVWALPDAATFTANLPCLPDSEYVVSLMGQVAENQQWGIEVIPNRSTAVKGGWGPSAGGGYVVRQIGLLTRKDGKQTAFALTTYAPGASLSSGIAALNRVGQWLGARLAALPAGRC